MPTTLVLGSRNKKKLVELQDLLRDLPIELRGLESYPQAPEIDEDGATFEANAQKKATELAKALHEWVLGEDSGLVVPALGGQPGVRSARFAGRQGDDAANNQLLLERLVSLADEQRNAYYVSTAAISDPDGVVRCMVNGRCHGRIIREYRGGGGFGYDPLFLIPEYHRTFGELSLTVKQALSHRGRALEQLRPRLQRLITSPP